MKTLTYIVFALFTVLFAIPLSHAASPPEIRVLIVDSERDVLVEGAGAALEIASGSIRQAKRRSVRLAAGKLGLVSGRANFGDFVSVTSPTGRYRINGRTFRGSLDIVWKAGGSLLVVDRLPIEGYLAGLINGEISSSWPEEAIKTQAVAARSYALNQIEASRRAMTPRPYDLTNTMFDQVYEGAHREDDRSRQYVEATRGEVLLRNGAVFPAYYHSCCGGKTEHAQNVWTGETGPPVKDDPFCRNSPKFAWSHEIAIPTFTERLRSEGIDVKTVRTIAALPYTDSPRVEFLLIEDDDGLKMAKATDLRRIFGYQNIKSTWFDAEISGNKIIFRGRGYGHGVGLCQWGAKGMAEEGIGYRDILKYYYPDAEVVKLY